MRVSLSWLKEMVTISVSVEELAEKLSMSGFEVEAIDDLSKLALGVVIGFVNHTKPHPNADRLTVCEVDIGKNELLQIVCGASNVRSGIHVPVATVGTHLPSNNLTIKKSELRGVSSEGMICSKSELGINGLDEGILILDDISNKQLKLGDEVSELLGLDDKIIDLAITANRPDGMSLHGIAREVSAITNSEIRIPSHKVLIDPKPIENSKFNSTILENEGIYSITLIEGVDGNKSSPNTIKNRLENSGITSKNLIIDITNYIMLEQGQPLHAFDADKLEAITKTKVNQESFNLRQARNGEEINTIDGKIYTLDHNCNVVTCNDIAIALAGIMGGIESCVDENTRRIWLESAIFSQVSVRNSARKLGIRTESSIRYEKGIATQGNFIPVEKAIKIYNENFPTKLIGSWYSGNRNIANRLVMLRKSRVKQVLGKLKFDTVDKEKISSSQIERVNENLSINNTREISDHEIEQSLISIGCEIEKIDVGWNIIIPRYRNKDLHREIDLIEEISRLIGYDQFEDNLPSPLRPGILNARQLAERRLREILCNEGIQEITTLSLVGEDLNDAVRVGIKNPLLKETSHLRTSLLPEHLKACKRNLNSGQKGCWVFEIGNIFTKHQKQIKETPMLSGVICGEKRMEKWSSNGKYSPPSYYQARGILANCFRQLKIDSTDLPYKDNVEFNLHPGRACSIVVEGKAIGKFGQIHPALAEVHGLPNETYLFDVEFESLLISATRKNKWNVIFKDYMTTPFIERDIAFVVSKDCLSSKALQVIMKAGKPLLEKAELIDRFEGGQLKSDHCSLAYRLWYRSRKKLLTDEDVNPIHEKVREALVKLISAELRS